MIAAADVRAGLDGQVDDGRPGERFGQQVLQMHAHRRHLLPRCIGCPLRRLLLLLRATLFYLERL